MAKVFNNIILGGRSDISRGSLKINEAGFVWKDPNGKSVNVNAKDLRRVYNVGHPESHQLGLQMKSGRIVKFDGISETQLDEISSLCKKLHKITVEPREICTKGWNWGEAKVDGSTLSFYVDGAVAFDIPLSTVSQCQIVKTDLSVQFDEDEGEEVLSDITFYMPHTTDELSASTLHEAITSNADMLATTGSGIATIKDVAIKVPRGKSDLIFFSALVKIEGPQSFTLSYDKITMVTPITSVDLRYKYIIITVYPALKRGHSSYAHIVIQTKEAEEVNKLSVDPAEVEKHGGKLKETMTGNKHDVILQVLCTLAGKKPMKKGFFQSADEVDAVACSIKANTGHLYPMDKCLVFLPTPPIIIKYSEIVEIEFCSVTEYTGGAASTRIFDMVVFMNNSTTHMFKAIEMKQYTNLVDFLSGKNILLKKNALESVRNQDLQMDLDDDEEDDDFEDMGPPQQDQDDEEEGLSDENDAEDNDGDEEASGDDDEESDKDEEMSDDELKGLLADAGDLLDEDDQDENVGRKRPRRAAAVAAAAASAKAGGSSPKTKRQKAKDAASSDEEDDDDDDDE